MSDKILPMFVRGDLDELRLSLAQFRLYAHIVRRGELNARPDTTADICCLAERTMWQALRDLETFGMITRRKRPGTTSVFTAAPESNWNIEAIRNRPRRTAEDKESFTCRSNQHGGANNTAAQTATRPPNNADANNTPTHGANSTVTPGAFSRAVVGAFSTVESYSHEVTPDKLLPISESSPSPSPPARTHTRETLPPMSQERGRDLRCKKCNEPFSAKGYLGAVFQRMKAEELCFYCLRRQGLNPA